MPTSFKLQRLLDRDWAEAPEGGRGKIANGDGDVTVFIPLAPHIFTSIILTHNTADAPTIEFTNTLDSSDDLENENVLWAEEYDGSNNKGLFSRGDSKGFTGARIISNSPTNGDVEYSLSQYANASERGLSN